MTAHILRRRKYELGATRDAEWPCANCGTGRPERLEADDERGRLRCVMPCRKCNPNAVEVL